MGCQSGSVGSPRIGLSLRVAATSLILPAAAVVPEARVDESVGRQDLPRKDRMNLFPEILQST